MSASNLNESIDEKAQITCTDIYDRFILCTSPKYQMGNYRRYGNYEDCMNHTGDWWTCMMAKLITDPEKKQAKLDTIKIIHEKKQVNDTWTYKAKPSWNDEDS